MFSRNTEVMPFANVPRLSNCIFLWDGGISISFFFLTRKITAKLHFYQREEVVLRAMNYRKLKLIPHGLERWLSG